MASLVKYVRRDTPMSMEKLAKRISPYLTSRGSCRDPGLAPGISIVRIQEFEFLRKVAGGVVRATNIGVALNVFKSKA